MLDDLRAAIAERAWQRALELALDAWRATRWTQLADLVDRIAAQCPTEPAPRQRVHHWWMIRARSYNPVAVSALVASADDGALRSDVSWEVIARDYFGVAGRLAGAGGFTNLNLRGVAGRNLVERFAAVIRWPDDPRAARIVTAWFCDAKLGWSWEYASVVLELYTLFAEHLTRLGDARVIAELERALAEPRGLTVPIRERQQALAAQTIERLAARVLAGPIAPALATEIRRWCPVPAAPVALDRDERLLWREVSAATDDDLGPALVLADALLQRGDRRGELVTLACTPGNATLAGQLLHQYWDRWLGELALVLERGGSVFRHGLLDIAKIGMRSTPEWAYSKVATHRELLSVRAIHPGWTVSVSGYVAFLDALGELPARVRITAAMVEALAKRRASWPIRHLELVTDLEGLTTPLADIVGLVPGLVPAVERIDILDAHRDVVAALPALRARLPAAEIRVEPGRRD